MNEENRLRQVLDRARSAEEVAEGEWQAFLRSARRSLMVQRFAAVGAGVVLTVTGALGASAMLGDGGGGRVTPIAPTQQPSAVESAPSIPSAPPTDDLKPPPDLVEREVWLVDPKTDSLSWGTRLVPGGNALTRVIEELLRGPMGPDLESGFVTEIPKGTELLSADVVDGTARINLTSEFLERDSEGSRSILLRQAQVVFTTTQLESVDSVLIQVDGNPYAGVRDTLPTTRETRTYGLVVPAVVVNTPKMSQDVSSPLTVNGTVVDPEGDVAITLQTEDSERFTVDGYGRTICLQGSHARCLTDFSEEIRFDVPQRTEARLVVSARSKIGQATHAVSQGVSIPITLLPEDGG